MARHLRPLVAFMLVLTACPGTDGDSDARCGDGVVQSGETCDDGAANSDAAPDACRTTCIESACGDGTVDTGEACDDGGLNSDLEPDACRTDCSLAACGDGVVDVSEACDEGTENDDLRPDACRTRCLLPACGDGVVDQGEACDDGVANSDVLPDACRTTCALASCGDGFVDDGETCDQGVDNSDLEPDACRSTCVPAHCGDGTLDTGESCDEGPANSDTAAGACRTTCALASCGDGILDPGEACDDGAANSDTNPDACRTTCTVPWCGDGVVDAAEACDAGAANSDLLPDACRTTCALPVCGDGVVDGGETCDAGAANSDVAPDACRTTCLPAACGDGVQDQGEACDEGAANDDAAPDACRTTCALPACGDGTVDAGESCDAGPLNSNTEPNACRTNCEAPACGDGVQDQGEACDEGAANNDAAPDACRTTCVLAACGDGVKDSAEACDEGSENSDTTPDACRRTCVSPACGDGVQDAGEGCDQGAANSDSAPGACRTTCLPAACGDAVVDPGEDCDDGALVNGDGCSSTCASEIPLVCTASGHQVVNLHTAGTPDGQGGVWYHDGNTLYAPESLRTACGGSGGEVLHGYKVQAIGDLVVRVTGTYSLNAVVAVETQCGVEASALACAPQPAGSAGEDRLLIIPDVGPGPDPLFIHVDSFGSAEGIYSLHVSVAPYLSLGAACALDGSLGRCDPQGGTLACADPEGDGQGTCVPLRTLGQGCDPAEADNLCVTGAWCSPATGLCEPECGNGRLVPGEQCDDGNRVTGDGCTADCRVEGWSCAMPYDLAANGFDAATGHWNWASDTTFFTPDAVASCGGSTYSEDGVAAFTAPSAGDYTFAVDATFDALLELRLDACGTGPVAACSNAVSGAGKEVANVSLAAGQTVYALVDGKYGTEDGPFVLTVSQPVCGNGLLEDGEQCDDGGTAPGDGCNPLCAFEGATCSDAVDLNATFDPGTGLWAWSASTSVFTADYGATCAVTTGRRDGVARFVAPADGTYAFALETAFDAVLYAWDGPCDPLSPTLACSQRADAGATERLLLPLTAGQTIHLVVDGSGSTVSNLNSGPFRLWGGLPDCGNGIREPSEQCDDGNPDDGDGCSAACTVEPILELEPNGSPASAHPIAVGEVFRGAILHAGTPDYDYYSLEAAQGTTYTFETFAGSYWDCTKALGTSRDTRIRLFGLDGVTELATDDDGGLGGVAACSRLTWTAPASGTYYLRVQYYTDTSTTSTIDPYFFEVRSP